jgi:hypothetical protein
MRMRTSMNNQLVQNGFLDLEEVRNAEPIQITYDYSRVTPEQADKLETIYNRMFMRHLRTAYEDGKDLLEAKNTKNLPHDEFIAWAQSCYGWSKPVIERKINRALYWGDFSLASEAKIDEKAIDTLSTKRVPESVRQEAKALLNAGESIDEERAKQLRDEQRAREKAEKDLEAKERELALFKLEVDANEQAYTTLVQGLEQQLEEKPEPVKVIEYQDTLETAAKVATLEQQIKDLEDKPDIPPSVEQELASLKLDLNNAKVTLDFYTTQNAALAEKTKQLSEESTRSFVDNIAMVGQLRIRQEWQAATSVLQASHSAFHLKVPSEIDRESFEGEEHTRTAQTIEVLEQTIAMLKNTLPHSGDTLEQADIVDAEPFPMPVIHEAKKPVIGIPPEYDELFAEYKQKVRSHPQPTLLWQAHGYPLHMIAPEKHIQFTKELLSSEVDRRVKAAVEVMKRTLGTWEG